MMAMVESASRITTAVVASNVSAFIVRHHASGERACCLRAASRAGSRGIA
jgi:hypothetical protein